MQIFHLVWTAAAGLRRWNGLGGGSGVTMTAASCPKTPRILRGARQNPAAGRHFSGFFGLKSSSLFDIVKNKQQKQRIAVSVRSFARVRLRPGASIGVMRRHAASCGVTMRPSASAHSASATTNLKWRNKWLWRRKHRNRPTDGCASGHLVHRLDPVAHGLGRGFREVQPTADVGRVNSVRRAGVQRREFLGAQPARHVRI